MQPQLQRVEIEPARARDHDLPVQHAAARQLRAHRLQELGVVAGQRLLVAALEIHLVLVAKHQGPEAVPLGLEDPVVAGRQLADALGEHRQDRGRDGQAHAAC